jgi:very-short-patch-repair endonuclease
MDPTDTCHTGHEPSQSSCPEDVVRRLEELGGLATRAQLGAATSRACLEAAVAGGLVVVSARGRYALPALEEARRLAHGLSGLLSLTSAALHHGWEVKGVPDRPHVTVPRKRKIVAERRTRVQLHRYDVLPEDVHDDIATGVELTLLQCGRSLPFDEALAIFDSAARHGVVPATFRRVARMAHGPGSAQVRRLARLADGDVANVFESVLRAVALDVPGLSVRPQVRIRTPHLTVRPDLVDEALQIVLEADSFEWHGGRAALRKDARRYDRLVAAGWRVLRFAWEDVMFDQEFVRQVLVDTVALAQGQADRVLCRCRAA